MQQIQSFIFSASQGASSVYEQRIIYKIVEYAQPVLQGLYMKNHLEQLQHDYDNVCIQLPFRAVITEGSHNYKEVLRACESLMSKVFKVWDEDKGTYFASPLIYNVSCVRNEGIVKFYVARRIWDLILDFRRGYSAYDLNVALSLPTSYSMRLYVLMSSATNPITLSLDYLKSMFGVSEKYTRNNDFIKRVIEPSQAILEKACVSSFTFETIRKGNKILQIKFTPRHRRQRTADELAAMLSVSALVDQEVKIFLITAFNFTVKELGAHKVLLNEFSKLPYKFDVLYSLRDRVRRGKKEKGYVIAALRSEVQSFKDKLAQNKELRQAVKKVAAQNKA